MLLFFHQGHVFAPLFQAYLDPIHMPKAVAYFRRARRLVSFVSYLRFPFLYNIGGTVPIIQS